MCGLDDPVQHRLHSHTHTDNSCCTLAMMCLFLYIHASSHCMFTLLYFITAFVNVTPLDVFKKTMGRVIGDEKGVLLLQKLRHLQFCLWQPKHDLFSPYPNLSPVTCHLSPARVMEQKGPKRPKASKHLSFNVEPRLDYNNSLKHSPPDFLCSFHTIIIHVCLISAFKRYSHTAVSITPLFSLSHTHWTPSPG